VVRTNSGPAVTRNPEAKCQACAAQLAEPAAAGEGRGRISSAPAHFHRPGAADASEANANQSEGADGGAEAGPGAAEHGAVGADGDAGEATTADQRRSAEETASKRTKSEDGDGGTSAGRACDGAASGRRLEFASGAEWTGKAEVGDQRGGGAACSKTGAGGRRWPGARGERGAAEHG